MCRGRSSDWPREEVRGKRGKGGERWRGGKGRRGGRGREGEDEEGEGEREEKEGEERRGRGEEGGRKQEGEERRDTFTCIFSQLFSSSPCCVCLQLNPSLAGGAEPASPHQAERGRIINDVITFINDVIVSVHL